ncbi:MAG: hypothetical protein ACHQ1H_00135 [Nitrososphaerales archaeon]
MGFISSPTIYLPAKILVNKTLAQRVSPKEGFRTLGLIWDLFAGLIAVIGLIIGRIIGVLLDRAISFQYFPIVLAIIGVVIAGAGLKRKGLGAAIIVGIGLGLASPVTLLISNLL